MTDTMTSKNTDLSSWVLCILARIRSKCHIFGYSLLSMKHVTENFIYSEHPGPDFYGYEPISTQNWENS
jgi:hypothetical protein